MEDGEAEAMKEAHSALGVGGDSSRRDVSRKRRALGVSMRFLSKVLDDPSAAEEAIEEVEGRLQEAEVGEPLRRLLVRDVALGAVLHGPTISPLLTPPRGTGTLRASTGMPFYVDGYYFNHRLPEPLDRLFIRLADGGMFAARKQFPELFVNSDPAVSDPVLRVAIRAQGRLPRMPWEEENDWFVNPKLRLRKLVVGSIIDDVFSAVALVVGAERALGGDRALHRAKILNALASLRLPALVDREALVQIWRLRAPFNDSAGRFDGVPVLGYDGRSFRYPDVQSGTSLCVGMYPVVQRPDQFELVGGFSAFSQLLGPALHRLADGSVQYRLADVDLANVCWLAEERWSAGLPLVADEDVVPPSRPESASESDHWPILF